MKTLAWLLIVGLVCLSAGVLVDAALRGAPSAVRWLLSAAAGLSVGLIMRAMWPYPKRRTR